MESFESGHIEKLSPEARAEINKMIASLRSELGNDFDVEETSDEYIVTQGEQKTHIAKIAEILHKTSDEGAEEGN